jgi:UDP-N-acetylglucosamine 2-epimerase (non-hydrolysing)
LLFGTRPEAIKMAPVVQECARRAEDVAAIICVTGQHREMLAQVTDYFSISADLDLDVMRPDQTLAGLAGRCLGALDGVLERFGPDCVVAQGDTTTTFCASVAAFYRRVPFVHVEAGLRTGNLAAPWPEEFNRRVASLVATLHCAPTRRASEALVAEGVPATRVRVTGNPVIDALLWTRDREAGHGAHWARVHDGLEDRRLVLITGHRRESFGTGLTQLCRAIGTLAERFPDVVFLYPVHLNPNVREPVRRMLGGRPNVRLVPPAPYPEFVWLMDRATLILTDSGGIQEEAPSLGKPLLILRETTERPETLESGAAELVGTRYETIVDRATRLLTDPEEYARHQIEANPYGDGRAAARIVDWILERPWTSWGA